MPLRDHFHPPLKGRHHWSGFHGGWPMEIVRTLFNILPPHYEASPRIYLGSSFEVDVSVKKERSEPVHDHEDTGGLAMMTATQPTLTAEADLGEPDEYQVRIYDTESGSTLVAAIEIVSPSNKDRADSRELFLGKVANLVREGVSVSIVDLVTDRRANLYAGLLSKLQLSDPALGVTPPPLYAVTLRSRIGSPGRRRVDAWYKPMTIGQPLPEIPIWLTPDLQITLPLEPSYEETCRLLHIK